MAPWLVIPKLVLHFVSQTGIYSFQFISYARIILFSCWKKIRAFFLITKHVLTQIFFLYKYICEQKKAEWFEGINVLFRINLFRLPKILGFYISEHLTKELKV